MEPGHGRTIACYFYTNRSRKRLTLPVNAAPLAKQESPMSTEQCIEALWESHQRGDFFPQAWRGKLELREAYRVQLGLLDRKVARGECQAGWKVGLTADAMREMFGGKEPVFGYL